MSDGRPSSLDFTGRDYVIQIEQRVKTLEGTVTDLNTDLYEQKGFWGAHRQIMATWAVPITLLLIALLDRWIPN